MHVNHTSDREQRPSPEALLEAAMQETRGRLKIFLGAAPGVGKTYEMLLAGRAKRRDGIDVVIGVVETHGRKETEALLRGFEIVPRQRIDYKGHTLEEMDIDALLARRPKLALVDELAHTNAPGSRHPKRYLDVQELLEAGIDVYTTMNVQHVESLNDVVSQITRIRVREIVPDSFLDRADEVELVDLTPADLIQRLNEGKVYVPKQAKRALAHYFSPGNLTALRELALRRTAQRVDEQMLSYMRAHAIAGPWAAGERVLVCVSEHPSCAALVRYARRLADRLRVKWTTIYVETPRHQRLSEVERDRIADALRLAERLGGEAVTIPGRHIADDLIAYAQENNFTQIVVGKSQRSRWFELLHGSVVRDLVRKSGAISVHVMAGETPEAIPAKTVATKPASEPFVPARYLASACFVAAAAAISLPLDRLVGARNLLLVFMAAVFGCASLYGFGPSLFASIVSVVTYNFLFQQPYYNLTISDPTNVLALVLFLFVAALTSNLAARVRGQMEQARSRAKTTAALYGFSRKLAGIGQLDDLLWATAFQMASMLKVRVVILLPDDTTLHVMAGYPPEDQLDEADMAAAKWTWDHNHPAGRGADTLPGAKRLFLPMRTQRGIVGVLGIDNDAAGPLFSPDERRLLDALADQAAIAIERIRLAKDVDEAKLLTETERLRSALLTSISHDLRTPLASILGAITSLRTFGDSFDKTARDELMATVQEESERLNRFVGNLLDMTRLETGALEPKLDMLDLYDVVGTALHRAAKILAGHEVVVDLAADLPMVRLDFILFEQALFNLLDNAAKFAPAGSTIRIEGRGHGQTITLSVIDEGKGIPAADLGRIFDKFYRVQSGDRQRAGTGLGLAICRGFIEAMGGHIEAHNRTDRSGAIFTVTLPVEPAAARLAEGAEATPATG
jgi:two-component system sensor histidine kinase KdpD